MLIVINFKTKILRHMFKTITTFFLLLSLSLFSQSVKYSIYEKIWAIKHPFAAMKVKRISASIHQHATQPQLDLFNNGGKQDSYRHVYYMAAFAQKIGSKKLRRLGLAHEKTNYRQFLKSKTEEGEVPDSLGTVMDLYNNDLGLKLGAANTTFSLEELSTLVVTEIKKGEALIMKRDRNGAYLDCSGARLDLKNFSGKWSIPKCLVRSDDSSK